MKKSLTTALLFGTLIAPVFAHAQTAASLQAQINALLQQITVLQAKLGTTAAPAPSAIACHSFSANLHAGATGADVAALQSTLTKDGETVSATGYFGPLTAAAVSKFQVKYASTILAPVGLSQGTGFVGASTRAMLNALYGCQTTSMPTPAPTPTTTPGTPTPPFAPIPGTNPPPVLITPTTTTTTTVPVLPVPQPAAPAPQQSSSGLTATPLDGTQHTKHNPDDLGRINFGVSSLGGPLVLNKITVTFSGNAATPGVIASAELENQNGQDVADVNGATFSTSGNTATWTFASGTNGFVISAGATYSFTLNVDSTQAAGQAGVAQSLTASIANPNDVLFTDGLDAAATSNIGLPASAVPLVVNSVTYPVGQ